MTPDLFWIRGPWPGRLAISARPRGGDWLEDEIRGWRAADVDVVVSLLDKDEETQLALNDESRLTSASGIRFISFPITDRSVPVSLPDTLSLLRDVGQALEQAKNVAVHCRQGIGRSALIVAGALVATGIDPEAALKRVASARGVNVPETPEQRKWVEQLSAHQSALARN